MDGVQSCAMGRNFGFEILKFQNMPDVLPHIFHGAVAVCRVAKRKPISA